MRLSRFNKQSSCTSTTSKAKCEYCDAPAVGLSFMAMKIYPWCGARRRDLKEFAKAEVPKGKLIDARDEGTVSLYRS